MIRSRLSFLNLLILLLTLDPLMAQEAVTPSEPASCELAQRELAERGVEQNADWTPCFGTFGDMEMMLVPAGNFIMGSSGEQIEAAFQQCEVTQGAGQCEHEFFEAEIPQTAITFTKPFWIARHEVTNAQYKRCVEARACPTPADPTYFDDPAYADHPVVIVDWFEANRYATWRKVRLPTEAEWEYAARGPDGLVYAWGNDYDSARLNSCDVNCEYDAGGRDTTVDDGYAQTAPVGSYPTGISWVGAFDMSGNVMEWVSSIYALYPYNPDDGREGQMDDERLGVLRGGSWWNGDPASLRAAVRDGRVTPRLAVSYWGFRVVHSG